MSRAYGWADDGITIVEPEAKELRAMAEQLLAGGTLRGLVADLEERGIATATGKTWQPITIKRSLTNPRIIGKRKSGDQLVRAEAQPILDKRTFTKLVALLHAPERARFIGDRSRVHLLGGGIARCGVCGSALFPNTSSTRPDSYACAIRSGGCGKISIKADDLEADVVERVLARMSDASFRRDLAKSLNELQSSTDAERELAEIDRRFEILGEDFADGVIDRATMRAGTERVRARKATLELHIGRREVLDDLPEPDVEQIVQWWEETSKARRRDVVTVLLDHVTVKRTTRRGHAGIDPDRLHYEWKAA
ncbi:recombinase-like zinc beta ribbon protein [Rhodococcus sp. AG1013]|uniref:recombinase family protein n=1 Tax=Rhodococcus sp. AG1013 TaxID=2183996 RepID=UPI000E0BD274|nr:recombinase family protein [Rhodococcus sp. AG1013]RDI32472.1 recombinase-like zinc beta ribbon protein [Rhodococcus sp. AG1013]